MARKPTALSGAPVATRDIAIDGIHFATGAAVVDVDPDELDKALRLGAVAYPSEDGDPAPESEPAA